MQQNESDSLDWQAFRYISDEMSHAEVDAFEQQLASEQDAREAVARVVQLAQAIVLITPDVVSIDPRAHTVITHRWSLLPPSSQRRRIISVAWLSAAAATLLAGIFFVGIYRSGREHSSIASVWFDLLELRQESLEFPNTELLPDLDDSPTQTTENGTEVSVPSWLIEAVSGSLGSSRPDANWEDS